MPTLTTIAWERLIEPKPSDYDDKIRVPPSSPPPSSSRRLFISPALYTTPEPAPIMYSGPPSPSPYVVNHKRRGRVNLMEEEEEREEEDGEGDVAVGDDVEFSETKGDDLSSVDGGGERSFVSGQGDFFDADEEFFSDGSTPRASFYGKKLESELLSTKLNLLVEIEKRKTAEEVVRRMYSQWQRLGNLLSQNGPKLPPPPNDFPNLIDIESFEQLAQEVVVTRFVAEAIGRGEARLKAELDAEAIIQSKDHEISRLRDRLRYYEAVNHEMCQRNQEVMEVARKQRQRKKTQRRWIWSCLGISITIGSSIIAYSFLPQSSKPQALPSPSDSPDTSDTTSE